LNEEVTRPEWIGIDSCSPLEGQPQADPRKVLTMSRDPLLLGQRGQVRSFVRDLYQRLPLPVRRRLKVFRHTHETPLHTMLPLPLPETIHIDPSNLCNFRCVFCPTADKELLASVHRPQGMMDFDLFTKIIDELKSMTDRQGRRLSLLHLYKDGEPLIHRRFPEMAAYAKRADVAELVSTTSNGALLTEELSIKLIESGLDQIRFSIIHVNADGYRRLTRTFSDYERVRANIAFLHGEKKRRKSRLHVLVKTNDSGLSEEEKGRFVKDFTPLADMLTIDTLMGWSLSEVKDFTLGVAVATGMDSVSPLRERRVCPEPFARLAVNFDGQVSVCCVDWSYGTIVGDLRTETLAEVWNGEKLREFRLTHLEGRREAIPACAHCQYIMGAPLRRDLDKHASRLASIYRGA